MGLSSGLSVPIMANYAYYVENKFTTLFGIPKLYTGLIYFTVLSAGVDGVHHHVLPIVLVKFLLKEPVIINQHKLHSNKIYTDSNPDKSI